MDNLDNGSTYRSSCSFSIMTLGNDPIKQLTTGTQFHHKVNGLLVLIRTFELHNIRLSTQMLHNLNLPFHVLLVALGDQFPLGYRLASVLLPGGVLGAKISDAELAFPQFFAECVVIPYLFKWLAENRVDPRQRLGAWGLSHWLPWRLSAWLFRDVVDLGVSRRRPSWLLVSLLMHGGCSCGGAAA
ncbi:hypothetical protein V6N13_049618 [Hibiscus sabdariffa]